jgi:hypothetical protein
MFWNSTIFPDDYVGGLKPGEASHSLIWLATSNCLIFVSSTSFRGPGGTCRGRKLVKRRPSGELMVEFKNAMRLSRRAGVRAAKLTDAEGRSCIYQVQASSFRPA